MGFETVNLSEIQLEKPESVPVGDYTFQLVPGAQYRINKNNGVEELNVPAAIADGDYSGRRVWFNYPDPTAIAKSSGKPMTWSAQALKKLEIVLGVDALPGEDPATYLNRVATSGQNRFGGKMKAGNYTPAGETEPRAEFSLFDVKPAA